MKLIFNLRNVGLGNNGGSSTLVKCGNTLVDLGHEVYFIDSGKNQHTWTSLKAEHIRFKSNSDVPSADFIIATGYKSVAPTMRAPGRFGYKTHYIRGWETWQMPVRKIVNNILKTSTIKLVNSICLQRKLKEFGVDSHIIRPGYDLNDLYPEYIREKKNSITLGGLYTKGKHIKIKRTNWIFDCYLLLKKKHKNLKLWLFGNDMIDGPHNTITDKFFYKPSMDQKNYFYNNVDIWLSPAMQEGSHMPPAEAMMTGCPVVGTNADMSGTEDYLIHNYNGLISKNNFQSFLTNVEKLVVSENLRIKLGKHTRKKMESLGDRETNMRKLIDYFMGIIT
jgi:glycosyltransferase involved in cell wall biosynthesis